jgi:very-short-patch-repair endonuclease
VQIAHLAAAQWGIVSVAQLHAIGIGHNAIRHRILAGRLHRVHRAVYAVGHPCVRREGRALAAVLACGAGAALSHRSAAAWWGLLTWTDSPVEVTSPHGRHAIAGVRRHQARSLATGDTTADRHMPITSIARTLLDLAATVPEARLERAVAQAERLRLYDHATIADVLARAAGHRGRAALARATAREPAWTRNGLEARFLALARRARLPPPKVNDVLGVPDHPRMEVDFHWPTRRLVVETDGWETHRTRSAFEDDRRRDAALVAAGYTVLRFTWRAVVEDDATVVRRLEAAASGR